MKAISFFIFLLTVTPSISQEPVRLSVGGSAGLSAYDIHVGGLFHYKVFFGTQFFDKLKVEIETGFMNNKLSYNNTKNMQTLNLGLNLDYRFLKESVVSPKVSLGGGFFPYTNLKGERVREENLSIDLTESSIYSFKSWGPYFNGQLFLSIKMKQFYLDIGGGASYLAYKLNSQYVNNPPSEVSSRGFGWCATLKLSYVFGGKAEN